MGVAVAKLSAEEATTGVGLVVPLHPATARVTPNARAAYRVFFMTGSRVTGRCELHPAARLHGTLGALYELPMSPR